MTIELSENVIDSIADAVVKKMQDPSYNSIKTELEPCDDAISRQAVIEQINCWIGSGEYKHTNATYYLTRRMQDLPPVTPQPCEDAISRQELLKAISTWDKFGCDADTKLVPYNNNYVAYIHYDDVINCIKGMPFVTTQPKPNIKALGEDIRICQKSITDKKVLIGFNMAVALCNKHLAESEVQDADSN